MYMRFGLQRIYMFFFLKKVEGQSRSVYSGDSSN